MHYTHAFISLHARGQLTRMQTHARTHIMYKYMYVTHIVFAVPYYYFTYGCFSSASIAPRVDLEDESENGAHDDRLEPHVAATALSCLQLHLHRLEKR